MHMLTDLDLERTPKSRRWIARPPAELVDRLLLRGHSSAWYVSRTRISMASILRTSPLLNDADMSSSARYCTASTSSTVL